MKNVYSRKNKLLYYLLLLYCDDGNSMTSVWGFKLTVNPLANLLGQFALDDFFFKITN